MSSLTFSVNPIKFSRLFLDNHIIKTAFEKQRLPSANNGAQIRNPNIEMRNNIKIRKSNDQNISGTYTIFTRFLHVLNLGFMSSVFVSDFVF